MSYYLSRTEKDDVANALRNGDGNALREEFCKIGLLNSPKQQEIMLKALNGCAEDAKCRKDEGLVPLELYSKGQLVTDPELTGDTLKWKNSKGQSNEYTVKPCDAPTS